VLDLGQPQHAQKQAQYRADDDTDHGHLQRHEKAFDEQRRVAFYDAPAEIHVERKVVESENAQAGAPAHSNPSAMRRNYTVALPAAVRAVTLARMPAARRKLLLVAAEVLFADLGKAAVAFMSARPLLILFSNSVLPLRTAMP